MKKEFEGKKLLILGANAETVPLVETANEMGIKTIVTSSIPHDAAKKKAWKAYDIDGLDAGSVIALAKKENADGVLVGVADVLVSAYCRVCNALNLPCYATEEIVDIFNYKDRFKACCEKYGIHGIPEYYLDEELRKEDIDKIEFPVMVKPVDSHSGLGMTVCRKKEELAEAVKTALSESKSKRFIVEQYMECEDTGIYYTFQDGECSVSCIYDRYTTDKQPGLSRVNMGSIYPSKHTGDYFKRMHANAVRMFREIGIMNGVLLISAFYKDGEFYVYDPGFRLQGEAPHLILKAVHGYDHREMLIRFALTGSEGNISLEAKNDVSLCNKCAATLWILLKSGKIGKITGLNEIEKDHRVAATVQRLSEGDTVEAGWAGTEKQVLARIYIVCDSPYELEQAIRELEEQIHVTDSNNNDMIIEWLDASVAGGTANVRHSVRTAVITGGTRGIGYAIAKKMIQEGYQTAIIGRNERTVKEAALSLGKNCKGYCCDISDTDQITSVLKQIRDDFCSIDVLVNNAGILDTSRIDTLTEAEWDRVLNTNLKGCCFMIQKAVPYLEKGNSPRIINISSNAGRMGGYENGLAYTASKGGMIALTYGAARRLAKKGITVNCIAPGTIQTEMSLCGYDAETQKRLLERFPVGRMGYPQEIASAVCYFAGTEAGFTTGAVLDVNGGMFMG